MVMIGVRLLGGYLGFVLTRWILYQTILRPSRGEAAIADGMGLGFLMGGWIVVPFYYALGIGIGMWIIIPAINVLGRMWQRLFARG